MIHIMERDVQYLDGDYFSFKFHVYICMHCSKYLKYFVL